MAFPQGGFISPRSARRIIDNPDAPWGHPGAWELGTGRRTSGGQYARSAWAFAAANIRAAELAALPWRIADREGRTIPDHPVVPLLREFGTESNYVEGVAGTELDLLQFAAGYWLLDGDVLQKLDPQTIEVVADPGGIRGFKQTIDHRHAHDFRREEITYFHEYGPDSQLTPGVPIFDVIKKAIAVEWEASLYIEAHFRNDATPALFLGTDQALQVGELQKIIDWFKEQFQGSRKKGKIGAASHGLKPFTVGSTVKDAALVEVREQARSDICTGMRVPKILVGSMVDATYANAQEARKFMLEDVIITRSKYFAGVINQDLVRRVDPSGVDRLGVHFEFEPQKVELLQESANAKWERIRSAVEVGALSLEAARAEMGWPETSAPSGLTPEQTALRAWRRKSAKALAAGTSPDVNFETDEVSVARQAAIRAKLRGVSTKQGLEDAFR